MKKFSVIISLIAALSCMVGCAVRKAPEENVFTQVDSDYRLKQIYMCDSQKGWAVTAENELLITEEGPDGFSVVKKTEGINPQTDGFLHAAFSDSQTAYLTYFSSDDLHLIVEYTHDGGTSWQQTLLNYTDYGDTCDAGSAVLSFADADSGYLLYCSSPGAGIMTKILLKTTDGGESFTFVKELTDDIAGYPQGIFFDGNKGYIAVSYHGQDNYLYKTSDGGATWADVKILTDKEDINYAEGYAPVFSSADSRKGMLALKTVGENTACRLFTTEDGGDGWTPAGELACDALTSYSYVDDSCFLFVDNMGNLFELSR